jgi:hypothetical protein
MIYGKVYLAGIVALAGTTSIEAREASLELFNHFDATRVPVIAVDGEVAVALRSHFQTLGPLDQPSLFETHDKARNLKQSRHSRTQRHMGAKLSFVSYAIQASPSLSAPAKELPCEAGSYAPTWWLSPAVEIRRAADFRTVASIACEFGIPTSLLDAVIAQESGYKSRAVSSAGAMGIMQIMPGTAQLLGLANPFDPVANMRAGARYLRQQLDRFGRVDLALAAYNAGPERRSLRAGYVPTIPETRNYVRTITTNWARLARMGAGPTHAEIRGNAAMTAIHASGYRTVELVRYDGLYAANPM